MNLTRMDAIQCEEKVMIFSLDHGKEVDKEMDTRGKVKEVIKSQEKDMEQDTREKGEPKEVEGAASLVHNKTINYVSTVSKSRGGEERKEGSARGQIKKTSKVDSKMKGSGLITSFFTTRASSPGQVKTKQARQDQQQKERD